MVTLIEEIDPYYYKYFIYEDKLRTKCIYAESNTSIYGILDASLLFWGNISKILEEMVYQVNEYYWCFMNNIIDNKQCTIIWHVDSFKTSHVDPAVVSSVLSEIYA